MKAQEYILAVTYFSEDFPNVWIHCPHAPNKNNCIYHGDYHRIRELENYIQEIGIESYLRFRFIGTRLVYPYCKFSPEEWKVIGKSSRTNYNYESYRYHSLYNPSEKYPRYIKCKMIEDVTGLQYR